MRAMALAGVHRYHEKREIIKMAGDLGFVFNMGMTDLRRGNIEFTGFGLSKDSKLQYVQLS